MHPDYPSQQTQELWSFAVPALWLTLAATPAQLERLRQPANALLLALFLVHYLHRDFIFPLRIRGGKPTPFVVWLMVRGWWWVVGGGGGGSGCQ